MYHDLLVSNFTSRALESLQHAEKKGLEYCYGSVTKRALRGVDMPSNSNAFEIQQMLVQEYGALICSSNLWRILGYPTANAYRKARYKGTLPIKEIVIAGRRGRFVLAGDVARWLAKLAEQQYEEAEK